MGTIQGLRSLSPLALVFVVLQIVLMECSNLEVRLPMVKEGPPGSLFGLSVAEHRVFKTPRASPADGFSGSLVLVGAPRYEAPDAIVPKTGGVFKCPLSTFIDDCEDLQLDTENNTATEDKTDQWLGVTVRSQGPGGKVAACAHRYKVLSTDEISGYGKCYRRDADLTADDYGEGPWKMCINLIPGQSGHGKKYYGFCQGGTGLYIAEEDGDILGQYISGGPGAGDWRGSVFSANVIGSDGYQEKARTTLTDESTGVGLNSYLGFSVTGGKFADDFLVAAGAPRHNAIGAVVILSRPPVSENLMESYILEGEQLTESFGYEVCSADLDGDGYDDLLVGAPIYFDRETEAGGRVYVYLNKQHDGNFTAVEPIRLTGPRDSMFGIAITNLGDLNLDGYEDVAIGAPYENNGEGAVYIYLGGPEGIVQPESQKITPSDLPGDLPTTRDIDHTFGYALSGGIDLDGNQYPDLSVGAFEASTVVTFRAKPIVSIDAELILQETEIAANATNFVYNGKPTYRFYVEVRMQYFCNAYDFDLPLKVEYSIEAEEDRREQGFTSRIIFERSDSYAIRDQIMDLSPQSEEIPTVSPKYWAVLRPGFTDIFRKIPFRLRYKLPDVEVVTPRPGDELPDLNPLAILDSQQDPSYVAELDFIKACAQDDGECITDLDLEASMRLEGQPPVLRVGVHDVLYVNVVLRNREEPAYDAKLTITFPEMLEFSKIEDSASQLIRHNCDLLEDNATVILCNLGNPYPELHVEAFTIKFDASGVPSDAGNFTILMSATSTNRDSNPSDNQVELFAEVESITDLEISGKMNKQQYRFGGKVRGESAMEFTDQIGDKVIHTWSVINRGPGIVPESVLTISFPYEVANGKWLLYMTHEPNITNNAGYCEIDPIYVNELNIKERPVEPTYELESTVAPTAAQVPPAVEVASTDASVTTSKARRKREAEVEDEVVRLEKSSKSQTRSPGEKFVRLDCWNKAARCFEFKCYLNRLGRGEKVEIIVRSRLWNSTFVEDYIKAAEVEVVSEGRVEILNAPFLTQFNLDNDELNLTMTVLPGVRAVTPPEPLAWWIILLAVLGGLLILIILILLLWKVGFFRRPGTRSGGGGPCGFFERKSMAYKYATVTQKTAGGNAATEKTAYYDEKYFT